MDDARRAPATSGDSALGTPQEAAGQTVPQARRHRRSHGSRSHRHQSTEIDLKSQRRRFLRRSAYVAVAVLCLAVAGLTVLLLRTWRQLESTRDRLVREMQAAQGIQERSTAQVQRLTEQLQDLASGRLPKPVRPLLTGELIKLDQGPLDTIWFNRVGTPERPGYEYKLICRNTGPERYQPRLRLLVFSEVGIQTGSAEITDSDSPSRTGAIGVAVGESASFSGEVKLEFGDTPQYFMVIDIAADGQLPYLSR